MSALFLNDSPHSCPGTAIHSLFRNPSGPPISSMRTTPRPVNCEAGAGDSRRECHACSPFKCRPLGTGVLYLLLINCLHEGGRDKERGSLLGSTTHFHLWPFHLHVRYRFELHLSRGRSHLFLAGLEAQFRRGIRHHQSSSVCVLLPWVLLVGDL